ncbi:2Fe-2S iron-sulfur cluster-binding protein [Iodobacter sp. CM08]|uniref:2Fe-2S iron-sulfur cluster-binding protein n=1 Tax=Iodobacter sp. CM08 TaxID=3085902 RepID=UPI0029825E1A|nr:2Fe-2S iron-sulfur cluster-binding protein [Iodobacter sp. CM08]MDW5414996.1 2Fe-2S iron-sulfur cluster-binding protein [Iodobacter sp. CM08]
MYKLTFINSQDSTRLEVTTELDSMLITSVRELVSDGKLQLAWRCGQGTCGACKVRLEHAGSGGMVTLGAKERNVMARHAGLAADSPLTIPDTPALIRLACHIQIKSDLTIYV